MNNVISCLALVQNVEYNYLYEQDGETIFLRPSVFIKIFFIFTC